MTSQEAYEAATLAIREERTLEERLAQCRADWRKKTGIHEEYVAASATAEEKINTWARLEHCLDGTEGEQDEQKYWRDHE